MPKKTRLSEDASIYQPRKEQSEKEKLKDMSLKEKFSYLWDYYRYHALITIAVIAFISYMIYSFIKPNIETKLYVAIVNNTIESLILEEYEEKMTEYLELNQEIERVSINHQFYFNGSPDYTVNIRQAFAAYIAAADIDVIIAPLSEFSNYVEYGYFTPLTDQLPTDLYSALTDSFYLSDTDDNPRVVAYGLYLSDTKLFKEYSFYTEDDPYLIGIVINSTNKENSVEFIRYLFNEK